jgi:3',5'-cyclic AMP phosphodiesterase CpdA
VIVLTGDLVETPDDDSRAFAQYMLEDIDRLVPGRFFFIIGNHDVRLHGVGPDDFRLFRHLRSAGGPKVYDDLDMTLVGFDSCVGGDLAQGLVGREQLFQVGGELDRTQRTSIVIGVLHHHPVEVKPESEQQRSFLNALTRNVKDWSTKLMDAGDFNAFVERRNFDSVLHGHEHCPWVGKTLGHAGSAVPVVGCGSSVGAGDGWKNQGISINRITIDRFTGSMAACLLAEDVPGAGLEEHRTHELIRPMTR